MTGPGWFTVVTALVAALRATSGYRDPVTDSVSIPVYDGPTATSDPSRSIIVVGSDGETGEAGVATSGWRTLGVGQAAQDETGEINVWCVAAAESDELTSLATARAALASMLADVGHAAAALSVGTVTEAHMGAVVYRQSRGETGPTAEAVARIMYTVDLDPWS
jgi:hypothetical protein